VRVAWFTPFGIKSAIGRYSKFGADALSKYAEVDIFTSDKGELHKTECRLVQYKVENVCDQLEDYDIVVYNMGDNSAYHSDIYEVMQKYPGVLINHDICLHNFMRGYYLVHKNDSMGLFNLMRDIYGSETADMLMEAGMNSDEYGQLDFRKYSLSEHIGDNAIGMIVHSHYHEDYIKKYYRGDLAVIALPDMDDGLTSLDSSISFNGYTGKKKHILTVGNVNENKRIHSIIKILGQNPELAEYYDYTVIGSQGNRNYCNYLEKLIRQYRLERSVKLLGFVNHKELAYYYQGADLISNLRFPAYEGASGSIVEQMSIGKVCLVCDTGVYSELEDSTVIKVDPVNEEACLKNILFDFMKNADLIRKTGENAKEYALVHFERDLYAKKVYQFLKQVIFKKPIIELADKCATEFLNMPGIYECSLPEYVLQEMYDLFN